jgi:hypothetical protein
MPLLYHPASRSDQQTAEPRRDMSAHLCHDGDRTMVFQPLPRAVRLRASLKGIYRLRVARRWND